MRQKKRKEDGGGGGGGGAFVNFRFFDPFWITTRNYLCKKNKSDREREKEEETKK